MFILERLCQQRLKSVSTLSIVVIFEYLERNMQITEFNDILYEVKALLREKEVLFWKNKFWSKQVKGISKWLNLMESFKIGDVVLATPDDMCFAKGK